MISRENLEFKRGYHEAEIERGKRELQELQDKIGRRNEALAKELTPLEDEYAARATDLQRHIGALTQIKLFLGELEVA